MLLEREKAAGYRFLPVFTCLIFLTSGTHWILQSVMPGNGLSNWSGMKKKSRTIEGLKNLHCAVDSFGVMYVQWLTELGYLGRHCLVDIASVALAPVITTRLGQANVAQPCLAGFHIMC